MSGLLRLRASPGLILQSEDGPRLHLLMIDSPMVRGVATYICIMTMLYAVARWERAGFPDLEV
jgi:hypothetical protein